MGLAAIPIEDINKLKPANSYLTAIEYLEGRYIDRGGNKRRVVRCKCKCGKQVDVTVSGILGGAPLSCGCLRNGQNKGKKYKKKPVVRLNIHKDEKKKQAAPVVKKVKAEKKKSKKSPPVKEKPRKPFISPAIKKKLGI